MFGTASGTTVGRFGTQNVDGGTAVDVRVDAGVSGFADQFVFDGGVAINNTIISGGFEILSGGGTASGGTIGFEGQQNVGSGGIASGTHIASGWRSVREQLRH